MERPENDHRLIQILEKIGSMAALDFSKTLEVSQDNDIVDAISLGLNMLSEELDENVVEKKKLDAINKKLEKFAYSTAHDLKSPLNSISGLVYLLAHSIDKNDVEAQELLIKLASIVDKMKNLVHGILEYSVLSDPTEQRVPVDLHEVVNEIIETDNLDEKAFINIEKHDLIIEFNRTVLMRIMRNLISNAVKYCDKDICKISVGVEYNEGKAVISVADNGPGIPKNEKEKIFELFHKYDPDGTHESQGIGLATVKNLLESVGESIWVESDEGEGCVFYFTISVHEDPKDKDESYDVSLRDKEINI